MSTAEDLVQFGNAMLYAKQANSCLASRENSHVPGEQARIPIKRTLVYLYWSLFRFACSDPHIHSTPLVWSFILKEVPSLFK